MTILDVTIIPALADNYIFLFQDPKTGKTAVVDPGESEPVIKALESKNLKLDHILITHHHWDHTDGVAALHKKYKAKLAAPKAELSKYQSRIGTPDRLLSEGDIYKVGNLAFNIITCKGHTNGHIAYINQETKTIFCGDILFSLGCGRLFEGTPTEAWQGIQKIRQYADDTLLYCAHEYTKSNGKFALSLGEDNPSLQKRMKEVEKQLSQNKPTIPTTIAEEKSTSPFMRADNPSLKQALNMESKSATEVFTKIRQLRDKV